MTMPLIDHELQLPRHPLGHLLVSGSNVGAHGGKGQQADASVSILFGPKHINPLAVAVQSHLEGSTMFFFYTTLNVAYKSSCKVLEHIVGIAA